MRWIIDRAFSLLLPHVNKTSIAIRSWKVLVFPHHHRNMPPSLSLSLSTYQDRGEGRSSLSPRADAHLQLLAGFEFQWGDFAPVEVLFFFFRRA